MRSPMACVLMVTRSQLRAETRGPVPTLRGEEEKEVPGKESRGAAAKEN